MNAKPQPENASSPVSESDKRIAAALRDNLRKRKQQQMERDKQAVKDTESA